MDQNSSPKLAALFGSNPGISLDERARVTNELNQIGSLTFKVEKDAEGWSAQCAEVPGIITGGSNPTPTDAEIEAQIREAIYAAFDVHISEPEERSPFFTYSDFNTSFGHITTRG